MSIVHRPQKSLQNHLHAAICLLALITARPANLDELLIETEKPVVEKTFPSNDPEDDTENLDDIEISISDDEKKRDLDALQNNVLDRLAEILARYKTDPKGGKGSILDPKHVSSTMMIIYNDENKVKILCAKNEGLNQGKSSDDTDFLNSWKACMERISRAGTATEQDNVYMFDLVLKYQQPRIGYYVEKLRHAFRFEEPARPLDLGKRPVLSDLWLQRLPYTRSRIWIDDSGNQFKILLPSSDGTDNNSKVALSAQSLRDVEDEVGTIICMIEKLSVLNIGMASDLRQEALLKELLPSLFAAWKSARFQASMKAQLYTRFQQSPNPQKRQNEAMTALKFLCRCYYAVVTFVQAAANMKIFQNVECIPVSLPTKPSKVGRPKAAQAKGNPAEIAQILDVDLRGTGWIDHLEKQTTKAAFKKLRGETCHVHAEIQILLHYNSFAESTDEQDTVHPYIGCSKRCCLLCWLLIRIDGVFQVRGSHETVTHRWKVPMASLTEPTNSKFQSISDDFLSIIKIILQNIFDQSFPLTHPQLLAQSSAALSTTQTVLDREKAEMERSQLRIRQMMMGQIVSGDDGLIIMEIYDKPGYVTVVGGSLLKPKEMKSEDAEIYKENHIRCKFGLEKSDEMPPKQSNIGGNACRHCNSPSKLRCSACRTKYCSRLCQKNDWRQHVFICTVPNRPSDIDYLKIIMRQWSYCVKKELGLAQIFFYLYSDNDLCKTFGFNNCHNGQDVSNLLCFYGHMTSKLSTAGVQIGVDEGNLGNYMEIFAELTKRDRQDSYCECLCITWFLDRRHAGMEIPNWEAAYAYQVVALRQAEHVLSLDVRDDDVNPLLMAEKKILALYSILFRDFNNIPGPLHSQWLEFGFCYCTNYGQRIKLAKLYLQLVETAISINEISSAYQSGSLSALMKSRSLDLTFFEANGILFHCPDVEGRGIYRLIAEVNHTLSARFCYCFMSKSGCHPKFENNLSLESDGDYGFHGTNTWERWQLFNFYKHVFDRPDFNARKMQEAKRHPDRDRLEQYLNSLVPDFQKNICNRVLGDMMFPKLKASVRFPHGRPDCRCVGHNTIASEGLHWATLLDLSDLRNHESGS